MAGIDFVSFAVRTEFWFLKLFNLLDLKSIRAIALGTKSKRNKNR
jgi:hypothetical protein